MDTIVYPVRILGNTPTLGRLSPVGVQLCEAGGTRACEDCDAKETCRWSLFVPGSASPLLGSETGCS